MENQDLEKSILILSRTRRNLSVSAPLESNGSCLLDKALAKQISVRQSELDFNLQRCGSVIVRASTPDPRETPCGENCLEDDSVFEDNNPELRCPKTTPQTPENSISLSYVDTTAQSVPGIHPPLAEPQLERVRGQGTPVITRAPLVPWSPSRLKNPQVSSQSIPTLKDGSLLEILTESASLLHPLFEAPTVEESQSFSIMDVNQSKRMCRKKERTFNQLARYYDMDEINLNLDAITLNRESWTKKLEEALQEYVEAAEEMIDDHRDALGGGEVQAWEVSLREAEKKCALIVGKLARPNPNGIQIPSTASLPPAQNNYQAQAERSAQVNIDIDADIVEKESKILSKEIKKFHDSDQATDEEIEAAMVKIDDWNKRFERIKDKTYAIQRNSQCYNLNHSKVSTTQAIINNLEQELNVAVDQLKEEDNHRCLYSLAKSKTATVKLPVFSGLQAEDFSKFRKEVEMGMKINRVRRYDQVSKLRECLRLDAKSLIPSTMINIDEAWKVLSKRYGDPGRVMAARKQKLRELGHFPPCGKDLESFKNQVQWLIRFETTLDDIMELANTNLDMEYEAYNGVMVNTIIKLFPVDLGDKLIFEGTFQYKVRKMREFTEKLRETKQELMKVYEGEVMINDPGGTGNGGFRGKGSDGGFRGGGNGNRGGKRPTPSIIPTAAVAFKPARRYEDCRVCNQLSAEGDTAGLYDNHTHDVAQGCPRFVGMGQKKRADIANKVKFCLNCLDAEFISKPGSTHANCPVKATEKKFYSCAKQGCMKHFLVCLKHVIENKEKMDKSKLFWSKLGVSFMHYSHMYKSQAEITTDSDELVVNDALRQDSDVFENQEVHHAPKAAEQLKELANGSKVVDVPEGEPLFLFSCAVGKTRPIKIFYDGGCSHVVIKDDIPVQQLPGIRTRKGPLTINGVGATQITVGDEWACLLDLADGSKQTIQGVTVEKITSDFPTIELSEATGEIKGSKPKDKALQRLRVPEEVGGQADILLGTLYNAIFPVTIHTLPCGLFIAKLKISSPGDKWTGIIGGPHQSFQALAEQTGSPSYLLAHFMEGLQNYRLLGAPKIRGPIITWEDEEFARCMTKAEVEDITGGDDYDDEKAEMTCHTSVANGDCDSNDDENGAEERIQETVEVDKIIQCSSCGKEGVGELTDVIEEVRDVFDNIPQNSEAFTINKINDPDEKLAGLKMLVKLQESGLSLEYRCPSCRDCSSCKNAPDTERISLREEAEDQAMRDAVHIDFQKKKITCSLPLRGKEEEFLSDNREIALKVLNSQCKKVQNDDQAKATAIKSFYKLFDGGYAARLQDLSPEHQKMILEKKVQHYLPWRLVHKQSISTPCRTVMDASSKTPLLRNGKGGRCLNDLTMKGKVNTLDLLTMLLRFAIGPAAYAGDLKQFYTSIGLTPSQWNLQRVLWREGLDMTAEVEEIIILSLIFGVRAVSALSEWALKLLADHVRHKNPRLAELLEKARFVDDLADSDKSVEAIKDIIEEANKLFESVGLQCKGWSISGSNPHPDVTDDGLTIGVGGMEWCPMIDTVTVKIPPLHFGKKSRGKVRVGTEIFDGSFEDLDKFVPKKLTRRMVVSKFAAIFDMYGHLTPETAKMKLDVSEATKETDAWDDAVTTELRSKIVGDLWRLFKLQGLKYRRAVIPEDAVNTRVHLTACVDAANKLKIVGVWARFRRKCGKYSSQLLIGRSLLSRGGTIPKEELEALTIGSNLLAVCRKALEGWLEDYSLFGDSVIAICWVTSEKKRLSLFHRNRVVQIRLHTDLEKILHLRTDHNPADIGTRPEKVKEDDVGPNSVWEKGLDWMHNEFEEALGNDIIKPAKMLRLKEDEEEEFEKGLIFEKTPEILVRGHHAFSTARVEKMMSRAEFSRYIFSPTKFSFKKVVRITAQMIKYLRLKKLDQSVNSDKTNFKMFVAAKDKEPKLFEVKLTRFFLMADMSNKAIRTSIEGCDNDEDTIEGEVVDETRFVLSVDAKLKLQSRRSFREDLEVTKKLLNVPNDATVTDDEPDKIDVCSEITEVDVSNALAYWYKKGSREVKNFNKPDLIARIAVERDGILYSRSRIMDGHRFIMAAGFNKTSLGKEVQLDLMTPVLDRHSPISYSVALFIHSELANHAGFETCFRFSLSYCHIMQAASLFREIGEECSKCRIIRKKYLDVVMGPVSDHQLTVCPPFYAAYCDLDGPYKVYVPGHERATRHRNVVEAKTWILSFACPVSKLINLQVIESKSADGVLDGLTRLGCEHGFPKYLLLDQEKSFMKAVKDAEVDLKDLSLRCFKERGILCKTAPVSGHNYTGLIERKIRTVQDTFEKIGLKNKKLHATGLQTVAKLVENNLNNLPLGFSYGKDADNTPLLKIITPNMMKIGRLNSRAVDGPIRFPTGPKDLMVKVEEVFDAFFQVWNISCVPKLIPQPKWFKESPELKPEDVVYFQKRESDLTSKWTIGQVDSVIRSKDGAIRRANVRFYNSGENQARFTDRAVRSLCRIFNVEDNYFIHDMAKVEDMIKMLDGKADNTEKPVFEKVQPTKLVKIDGNWARVETEHEIMTVKSSCACCCPGHCKFNVHSRTGSLMGVNLANKVDTEFGQLEFPNIFEKYLFDDEESDVPIKSSLVIEKDELYDVITSLETDFNLD